MKFWKHSIISAFAFLGIMTTVLYSACEKDSCKDLKCKNESVCVDGFCKCPTGFEGAECLDWANAKFVGYYDGSTQCDITGYTLDSALIEATGRPDSIQFKLFSDVNNVYSGRVVQHEFLYYDPATGTRVKVVEDGNKISAYIEKVQDGKKKTCSFIGTAR